MSRTTLTPAHSDGLTSTTTRTTQAVAVSTNASDWITPEDFQTRACYVRVELSLIGKEPVQQCSVRLQNVEKLSEDDSTFSDTSFDTEQRLRWSGVFFPDRATEERTLKDQEKHLIDVFSTDEETERIRLEVETQLNSMVRLFDAPGVYRLSIIAGSVLPPSSAQLALIMNWRGDWNDFEVAEEEQWQSENT